MENDDIFVLTGILIFLGIAAEPYILELNESVISVIHALNNWVVYTTAFLVLIIGFSICLIYINKRKYDKRIDELWGDICKQLEKGRERERLSELLEEDIKYLRYEEALEYISKTKKAAKKSRFYHNDLLWKIEMLEKRLPDLKKEFRVQQLRDEKEELKESIEALKEQKRKEEEGERKKRREILNDLDFWEQRFAFKKEDLTEKQIEALVGEGYVHVNEYCAFEKKVVPAMVDNKLGHSPTHVFLVWSIKRILEDLPEVNCIREHLTRDADITFRYKNKPFALEIETGTLLRKKKQLQEKVKYLNRKYGKKWMFIVSNRSLLKEYRKLGHSTTRKEVEKDLKNLLKSYTLNSRVSKQFYLL